MNTRRLLLNRLLPAVLLVAPGLVSAQQNRDVLVLDNEFDPPMVTIQTGDTIRWADITDAGNLHNVVSEDGLWVPAEPADGWTFIHRFNQPGTFNYYCEVHQAQGMVGTIVVVGDPVNEGVDFNAGHNGNWWNGPARNGEGAQFELADAGGGELVFVGTIYSYGPNGGQIFLIAVGTPNGDTVEVDVFITDGGTWGDDFDPNDVSEIPWGTGVLTSNGCDSISMVLTPNADQLSSGYTVLDYDLVRLTTPLIQCPFEG